MISDNIKKTLLLSDLPADSDECGGSHKRLAEAIADLILEEEGGRTIGIEGEWGTGKSTIIKLLEKTLEENKTKSNLGIFIFDAWAHEGDPLRRTYLERLIQSLYKYGWIDEKKWNKKVSLLQGQITESKTIKSPQITTLGKWILVASFLMPVGIATLNNYLKIIQTDANTTNCWFLIISLLLTVSPILILLFNAIFNRSNARWELLAQNFEETTTAYSTKTPDPTSVEFEECFNEIIDDALKNKEHRLVIILDNLDRVGPKDALSLLSALQTFLQYDSKIDKDEFKRLWVVIPYDKAGLSRLWKSLPEDSSNNESSINGTALSMMDKRFQIIFRVPPLIFSNWRDYFLNELQAAFPQKVKLDFYPLLDVFLSFRHTNDHFSEPTPREIKLLINQIGAIYRQWEDNFPLSHLLYFVLLCREGIDVKDGIRTGAIPSPSDCYLFEVNSLIEDLASMWFNVDKKKAMQILLKQPITEAISQRDSYQFTQLSQTHNKYFWDVLLMLFHEGYLFKEVDIANVAYLIRECDLRKSTESQTFKNFISLLIKSLRRNRTWPSFNEEIAQGIACLLEFYESNDLFNDIYENIKNSRNFAGKIDNGQEAIQKYMENIIHWFRGLIQLIIVMKQLTKVDHNILSEFSLPADPIVIIEFWSELYIVDPNNEFWHLCFNNASVDNISDGFSTIINNSLFSKKHIGALHVIKHLFPDIQWDSIIAVFSGRIEKHELRKISDMLEAIWIAQSYSKSKENPQRSLAIKGILFHHLIQAKDSNDYIACAWCIFMILNHLPSMNPSIQFQRSNEGRDWLNSFIKKPDILLEIKTEFLKLVSVKKKTEFLFKLPTENPDTKNFASSCIVDLMKSENVSNIIPSDRIIEDEDFLYDFLGQEEFCNLVEKASNESDLINVMVNSLFDIDKAYLYAITIENTADQKKRLSLFKWIKNGLAGITAENWLGIFKKDGDELFLLSLLNEQGLKVSLGVAFSNALVEYSKMVVRGDEKPEEYYGFWPKLIKFIASGKIRSNLILELIDVLKDNYSNFAMDIFFDLYGEMISKPESLMQSVDIVRRVFSQIIDKRDVKGLKWLLGVFNKKNKLLNEFKGDISVKAFKERIETALNQEVVDDASSLIAEIAGILKIKLSKKTST